MKHLYYVLTARCNEVCEICPRSNQKRVPDVDPDENLQKLESVIKTNRITDITLSGGEPSLYEDLPRVLSLLDDLEIKTVILSNSLRFSSKEFSEKIFGSLRRRDRFKVVTAIHSTVPAIHDGLTGVPGSLLRSSAGLKTVHDFGIPVEVKCVIGRHNISELMAYPKWVCENISTDAKLLFCGMDYAGMTQGQIAKYRLNFPEIQPNLEAALDAANSLPIAGHTRVGEIPFCAIDPFYWPLVDFPAPDGGLYNDSHQRKAIESKRDILPFAQSCDKCIVQPYCNGIWRTQYLEYGEEAVRPFLKQG